MALPARTLPAEPAHSGMSTETFKQLRDLIYEHTGILFADNKKYLLESRLQPRLAACQCRSYDDYYRFLKADAYRDREFTTLYAAVTTNETFFYRDEAQLETFTKLIVPALIERNKDKRSIRVWSAACSTGDEPYTLAMMLASHPPLANWTIDILATDISEVALDQARKGVYDAHALRKAPAHIVQRYFTGGPDRYVVAAPIMKLVRFMNINLYDRARLKLVRGIDVIFCRNCLIYFDAKARQQIVSDLTDALVPQGYLVIGFSESLRDMTARLKSTHLGRSVVYQRQ